ncbi:MAG TPA: hypothetical protein VMF64_04565 [Steroidobacteraceae bacterium]|nr:hypothetical protein [Steroidobacteraceae bacterium]
MKKIQIVLAFRDLAQRASVRRRRLVSMPGLLVLGGLAAASVLVAAPAKAGCVDPRGAEAPALLHQLPGLPGLFGSLPEHHTIVGTWHVVYTAGGAPSGEAFMQWHSDGTEWENINYPVLDGNICMGSWKQLNANSVARNHYGWLYDAGLVAGYFNETETDVLSKDGNSYSGNNEIKFYDTSGNLTMDIKGTASAQRIAP